MSSTAKAKKPGRPHRYAAPSEVLCIGFAVMILIGTSLLMLPGSTRRNSLDFMDALFTATSAVCVTGLSVFDPGTTLTRFGQVVLLVLIQLGGLGFMVFTSLISKAAWHRSSLHSRVVLRDSISAPQLHGLAKTAAHILTITFLCEGTGALLFMIRFVPRYGPARGVYYAVFQSISSFCNAGFDVYGTGDNMIPFAGDPLVNGVTMALVIMGGLGFFVILEVFEKMQGERPNRKLSLNTRIVLITSAVLTVGGAVIFMIAEWTNPVTLGGPDVPPGQRVMEAFFQSVTTRTAGFMTINQGAMRPVSKIVTVLLMIIGASPAGTGGGLKTTTTVLIAAFVWSVLQGKKDVVIMKRRIPTDLIYRAAALFSLAVSGMIVIVALITVAEPTLNLSSVIFETASAFGTAGLSTGITGTLSNQSLILLIGAMFGGRLGLFTVAMTLARRFADHETHLRYPEEKILIG